MVNMNRTIIRTLLIISYIMIITAIIAGISALFSYLNTGADRSSMLHTEIKKEIQYTPKITWTPLHNEGRKMDEENLKNLERDYINAWYVKHIAYKTNTFTGIDDYYTENARKNIQQLINYNKAQHTYIDATTLSHTPTLDFFSEDGQMAVITDNNVLEYKRIYQNNEFILETTEVSSYKIIFLLEDGFWRIRHFIKENTTNTTNNPTTKTFSLQDIKGINYYPKDTPWQMFGSLFDEKSITNDFKIIKNAGLNTVRIFVQYTDFGEAFINNEKLNQLTKVLDIAEKHQLKVMVTLFDFYGDYSVINWSMNQQHIQRIVSAIKNHKALLAWDVKNEPDLDFNNRGKRNIIAWLTAMIDHIRIIDPKHPITIGWSNTRSATILKDKVDFVSFHYYEDLTKLDTAIKTLKKETANKPLVMQEFGLTSYQGFWNPFGSSEKDQANYHKKAQELIKKHHIPYISWTLYDFKNIPKSVVGWKPWRKNPQKKFGFITNKGIKKPAFTYIASDE